MAEPSQEFAALLARASQGDVGALAELVQRYEPKVRLAARVLLGPALRPHLDSLDLVQSVHKSLLFGLRHDHFDISSPDKLVALALAIVRRKVARHWRHLRRQQRPSRGAADADGLARLLNSLLSPLPDPARVAESRDQVRHLCHHLDETERRMLELRAQDYSTAEVARELGLNAVTLRVRLTRLRQRLRDAGVLTDWI